MKVNLIVNNAQAPVSSLKQFLGSRRIRKRELLRKSSHDSDGNVGLKRPIMHLVQPTWNFSMKKNVSGGKSMFD